jgi:hypothetical protein
MAFWPSYIVTPQEMRFRTGDGRMHVSLSGYAVFNFKGSGGSWRCDDLYIRVGPIWRRLDDVCPSVSLASISNRNVANNAGWAVDNCRWTTMGGRILLQSRLCIRDSDGYIHRVAYKIDAVGLV